MDSLDLIAKETEFKKLNQQIEKKSEKLLKEIEYVMHKQDFFSEFSRNLSSPLSRNQQKKHSCDQSETASIELTNAQSKQKSIGLSSKNNTKSNISCSPSAHPSERKTNDDFSTISDKDFTCSTIERDCVCCNKSRNIDADFEFLKAFVSMNVQENVLPKSFTKDRITIEGICKFLSSKVKLMQEQIDKLQSTIDKKAAQCEKHLTHQAELESERMTLLNRANGLRAEMADVRAKHLAMQNRLNEKDRLYKEQRSEADKLTSEVKRLRSKNSNVEARLAGQEELVDNLKQQLDASKRAERDFRDTNRSLAASHQKAISKLEEKIKTLVSCIEKQSALIDNLRSQNALLCANAALRVTDKEFTEFLKQDFQ